MAGNPQAREFPDRFADADAVLAEARYGILGAPYDATASFRAGAAEGPRAIREASWNFETLNLRSGVDLADVPVHDAGDADLEGRSPAGMVKRVEAAARPLLQAGAFPVLLGGEHSVTPPIVGAVADVHPDLRVLLLDAHLDYRAAYEGSPHSHACAARRLSDVVGPERVGVVGVRSAGAEELEDARRDGLRFATAWDVRRRGFTEVLHRTLEELGPGPLHLSLDIDALDPAHAPGTGTPEPYGLDPEDVLATILRVAHRLVGFDIVEVAPPWDTGITAALAARLTREVVAETWRHREVTS